MEEAIKRGKDSQTLSVISLTWELKEIHRNWNNHKERTLFTSAIYLYYTDMINAKVKIDKTVYTSVTKLEDQDSLFVKKNVSTQGIQDVNL